MTIFFDIVPTEVLRKLPTHILLHMAKIVDGQRLPYLAEVALQHDNPLLGFLVLERTIGREVSKTSITRELGRQDKGTVPSKMAALVYSHIGMGSAADAAAVYKWAWWAEEAPAPTVEQLERCMPWFCEHPPDEWKQWLTDSTKSTFLHRWRAQCTSNWGATMLGEWRNDTEMRVFAIVFGGSNALTHLCRPDLGCSQGQNLPGDLIGRLQSLNVEQWLMLLNLTCGESSVFLGSAAEYYTMIEKSLALVGAI